MSASPLGKPRRRVRCIAALVSTASIAAASLLLAPAAVAAPPAATLTIEATPATATEGDDVTVVVNAASVTDLYAFDFTFTLDPTLLAFVPDSETGPTGGFTSATTGDDTVTVSHTRLGSSPGLSTDPEATLEIARFTLMALGGGSATIDLTTASLVSSTAQTLPLSNVDSTTVTLTALPTAPPSPSPDPDPTGSSSPSPTPSTSVTPAPVSSDPLASTGADATPWLIGGAAAVALIGAGTLLVLRRSRAVSE